MSNSTETINLMGHVNREVVTTETITLTIRALDYAHLDIMCDI